MNTEEKDDSLFDLVDEEETEDTLGDDEIESTEIVGSANEPSSTIKNAGIVAVLGIIGYFIAQRFKKGSQNNPQSSQMETNFKPVDFGF